MGYNKIQRKLSAYVYSNKKLNDTIVKTYTSYKEMENVLNGIEESKGLNKVRKRGHKIF